MGDNSRTSSGLYQIKVTGNQLRDLCTRFHIPRARRRVEGDDLFRHNRRRSGIQLLRGVPRHRHGGLGDQPVAETNVVNMGSNLTYTIGIVNLGPSNATAVTLVDTLPQYADFVAAGASQGTVTQAYGVVRCDIGDLPMGGAATVAVTITPTAAVR